MGLAAVVRNTVGEPLSPGEPDSDRFADVSPIFVVSMGRSGSTLLRTMLNAHPDIQLLGELQFFGSIYPLRERVPSLGEPGTLEELGELIARTSTFRYLKEGEPLLRAVLDRMAKVERPTYALLHREFMLEYARRHGARRCGEKTPENLRYMPILLGLYPRARILHIVRDPRDAVASWRSMPWSSPDSLTSAVRWKCEITFGLDDRVTSRRDNFHTLRYEDLVQEPERELRAICRFIGEPFHPAMLNFHEEAGAQVDLEREPWKARASCTLDSSSISRWREDLPDVDVALIQALCGREMRRYGYELTATSVPDRLRLPLRVLGQGLRWIAYKVREARKREQENPDLIYPTPLGGIEMVVKAAPIWFRSLKDR